MAHTTPPQSGHMQPADASERILSLDVLRGMALFGILAGNMRALSAPLVVYGNITALFPGRLDVVVQYCLLILVQGKFVALFSFLFGIGFALQLARAESKGVAITFLYLRRMFVLAVIGLAHAWLIWWGDILLNYALCGMVLVLFRKSSQRTVFAAVCGLIAVSLVMYGRMFLFPSHSHAGGGADMAAVQQTIATFATGSWPAILKENWLQWKASLSGLLPPFGLYPLTVFLLGVLVARSGVITRLSQFRPLLKRVCIVCLPLGIALNVLMVTGFMFLKPRAGGGLPILSAVVLTGIWVVFMTLSAGYASAFALLIENETWQHRLSPFAFTGRLALTNYVMQSVWCTAFFYGTGLYGRVGPALGFVVTIVVYAFQIACSMWWLERFQFGPLEWLWRGLTYGEFPAMRKHSMRPRAVALEM